NPNNCGHICKLSKRPLKIYYTVSVRGSNLSKHTVCSQIEILKSFGQVLTEHLGSHSEFENQSDLAIWQQDQKWLTEADVVIADVTNPSLGVGYMLAKARELGKPVLCLYNGDRHTK